MRCFVPEASVSARPIADESKRIVLAFTRYLQLDAGHNTPAVTKKMSHFGAKANKPHGLWLSSTGKA